MLVKGSVGGALEPASPLLKNLGRVREVQQQLLVPQLTYMHLPIRVIINYYNIIGYILGYIWDNGKENGNYYNIIG